VDQVTVPELPFTGERFVPGTRGEIWIEHWHRYHFAARWAAGKRVLDVACGEGYGAALLARGAAHVTGVDVSEQAIAHARAAYAALGNVRFEIASCTQLPLPDESIDLAVSFETLEHIAPQEKFLDELARVLSPEGVLVLSCPNKLEYSDKRDYANEFHVRELYRDELAALVGARFPHVAWYGQRPTFFSIIAPEAAGATEGQLLEVSEAAPAQAERALHSPLYFVLVASRSRQSLEAVAPALSVLADRDDWVHRDYEKVMKMLEGVAHERNVLVEREARHEQAIAEFRAEAQNLRTALSLQETAIQAQRALADAQQAAHDAQVRMLQAEADRRRGWRWWLKLPLVRLGLLK
jgi:SAM-dependent methyltransferase